LEFQYDPDPGRPTNVLFQILIGVGGNQFIIIFFPPELIDVGSLVRQKSSKLCINLCVADPGRPTNVLFQILIGVGGNQFIIIFFPPELIDVGSLVRQKSSKLCINLCVADRGGPTFVSHQIHIGESGNQFIIIFFPSE